MFEMIFGSEKFEPLIGELSLAAQMDAKEDDPHQLRDFQQRRRQVQIAVNLVAMLDSYVEGHLKKFEEVIDEMCNDLATNSMGKLLTGVISYIYIEQATF